MSKRSSIFQVVQIGLESTLGAAVPANKQLQSVSISPGIQAEINHFRPAGLKFPTISALGKEYVEASLDGQMSYSELAYLLASVLSYQAPTGSGPYSWLFDVDSDGPDTFKAFTIQQGDDVTRRQRFAGGVVKDLSFTFSRSECKVSGAMVGQAVEEGISVATLAITGSPTGGTFTITFGGETTSAIDYDATASEVESALAALSSIGSGNVACSGGPLPDSEVTVVLKNLAAAKASDFSTTDSLTGGTDPASAIADISVTAIENKPVLPTHVSVYLADTYAGLAGASALTNAIGAGWSIADRYSPFWPLNRAEDSYSDVVETEPNLQNTLKMEADATAMGLLATMRQGATKFVRIEAIGELISGGDYYKLQIDTACQVENVSEFSDEDGVFAIEWTFKGVHDATWGKATEVQLVNQLAGL